MTDERHGLSWLLSVLELVPFSSPFLIFFFLILLWMGGKRCLLKWKGCNRCIVKGGVYLGLWSEIRHHLASMKKIAHQVMKRVTLKHPGKFYEHAQTYGSRHGRSWTPHRTLMLHMTSIWTLFGHWSCWRALPAHLGSLMHATECQLCFFMCIYVYRLFCFK